MQTEFEDVTLVRTPILDKYPQWRVWLKEAAMARRAEILEAAKHDPVLANMVKHNEPLTREQWIRRSHLFNGVPEPWTAENEEQVPRVFRKARLGDED